MSNNWVKKVKAPAPKPQPRYSDAVRKWGDHWPLSAPGGSANHWERTHDTIDFTLMKLMEQGTIGRVA